MNTSPTTSCVINYSNCWLSHRSVNTFAVINVLSHELWQRAC